MNIEEGDKVTSQKQNIQTSRFRVLPCRSNDVKRRAYLQFISSLLLPLVLGVFTFVITIQHQNTARQQRDADRNESQLNRVQDKALNEERYKNEVFDTYIREMATLLKESNGSLTYDDVTATVARAKTLNIFRKLDSQHNARIIRFLHEAKQLYDTEKRRSLDLSTAKLPDIDFRDLAVNEKHLHNLSLTGIFLSNATFVNIQAKHINFANNQFDNVSFSQSDLYNANFSYTRFNNTNFSYARLDGVNFSSAELRNINFSFARLRNIDFTFARLDSIDFSSAQLDNVNFSAAELDNINFSSFMPWDIDFTFARLKNIDFSAVYINNVSFASSLLFNCRFEHTTLAGIGVTSTRFDGVVFVSGLLHKVSFPNSSFFNTRLLSVKFVNAEFSSTQFDNTNISSGMLDQTSFISAKLHKVSFSSSVFNEANFSSAILDSVSFSSASIFNTDFGRAISIKADFASTNFSNSTFISADMQGASFVRSDLNNVDFSQANLHKANFTNAKITESQLQAAISIQDTLLPNKTLAHGRNFLNNGQTGCNISYGGSWILHKGNITTKISNTDPNNCYFFLQSYNTGATISQRVDLLKKWDFKSWPHSLAVVSANMSLGVSIQLRANSSTNDISASPKLNSTERHISLALDDDVRELEVFVEFSALRDQNSATNYWCGDIKLSINYGAYLEFSRVIPHIPPSARWKQNGVTVAGGHGIGSDTNQLNEPYSVMIVQDETMIITERHNDRVVQWKIGDTYGQLLAGGKGAGGQLDQLNRPNDAVIDKTTDSLIICDRDNTKVVRWARHNGTTQGESLINNIRCFGLAMDDQQFLYVSDMEKDEVKRYRMRDMNGIVVAGGNGRGANNSQLRIPTYIFVDQQQAVYVSDNQNHRVMKWDKGAINGTIVAGGNDEGNDLTQLANPAGLYVDTFDTVYVVDTGNNRIMRWPKGSEHGTVIVGGTGQGLESNQVHAPGGLTFDRRGNLYLADTGNHRVQRYSIE